MGDDAAKNDLAGRIAKIAYYAMVGISGAPRRPQDHWEVQTSGLRNRYLVVAKALIASGYIKEPTQ